MAKLEIYLVDTNTEVESHQTEDTKPGIFHDATNIAKEMDAKEMYANEQNYVERDVKMENGLNTNRYSEISAKHENMNASENVQNQPGVNKMLKLKPNAKTINCLNMHHICKRLKPQK